jgi:4-carboxymuconolactone decarboxylase
MTTPPSRQPRIAPLEPPFTPEVADALTRMMPVRSSLPPLALFRTLVIHPALADAMHGLARYLLGPKPADGLAARDRELVIQRVCARCGCDYEWAVHAAAYGPRVGLDDAQLRATAVGAADDPAFTVRDRLLVALVDQLHDTAAVDDALWADLARHFSAPQLVELLVLAGWYHAIAYVANGARVPREPWAPSMPQAIR